MGFYSNVILPRLLDWTMANPAMSQYRAQLLKDVKGNVLEIGFGTGLNLAYYPTAVEKLTTIDVNPGMATLAQKRIATSDLSIESKTLNGEHLPFGNNTFDTVVSTWTLCSIAHVEQALQEIHRVLKPGGTFYFIEHGLSDDPNIQVWQNRLNPIQKVIGDGCNLNRNIQALVEQVFQTVTMERFDIEKLPKVGSHTYRGVATKGA
jgi:ubiquinone/menaquinone biosynthesis C-methylase UbiE